MPLRSAAMPYPCLHTRGRRARSEWALLPALLPPQLLLMQSDPVSQLDGVMQLRGVVTLTTSPSIVLAATAHVCPQACRDILSPAWCTGQLLSHSAGALVSSPIPAIGSSNFPAPHGCHREALRAAQLLPTPVCNALIVCPLILFGISSPLPLLSPPSSPLLSLHPPAVAPASHLGRTCRWLGSGTAPRRYAAVHSVTTAEAATLQVLFVSPPRVSHFCSVV